MTRSAGIIMTLLCPLVASHSMHPQAPAAIVLYSNVEYNEETGDLLGFEIELHSEGASADGVLRTYQGGCGQVTPVQGNFEHTRAHLEGTNATFGKVVIDGMLHDDDLNATVRFEEAPKAETVRLKKIAKAHC